VDDAILFFRPTPGDMESISLLLDAFADASGLKVNMHKSHVSCIRCDDEIAQWEANYFNCSKKNFPTNYLGLPLSTGRLRRADIWPLIDKYSGN
jgi:hypothetical protein